MSAKINKKIYENGFTLVEMIVASAIFISVMLVAVTSLLTIINANRKSHDLRNVIDNVTFAIESISKDAQGAKQFVCGDVNFAFTSGTPNCTSGGPALQYKFVDPTNPAISTTTEYRFITSANLGTYSAQTNLQKRVCPNGVCPSVWTDMVAPYPIINITNLEFYVLGEGTDAFFSPNRRQPRIIITAEGQVKNKDGTYTKFNLQTTTTRYTRKKYASY